MNEETEVKDETKVENMTSEKLALILNQQYTTIIQAQQNIAMAQANIGNINKVLEQRTTKD